MYFCVNLVVCNKRWVSPYKWQSATEFNSIFDFLFVQSWVFGGRRSKKYREERYNEYHKIKYRHEMTPTSAFRDGSAAIAWSGLSLVSSIELLHHCQCTNYNQRFNFVHIVVENLAPNYKIQIPTFLYNRYYRSE